MPFPFVPTPTRVPLRFVILCKNASLCDLCTMIHRICIANKCLKLADIFFQPPNEMSCDFCQAPFSQQPLLHGCLQIWLSYTLLPHPDHMLMLAAVQLSISSRVQMVKIFQGPRLDLCIEFDIIRRRSQSLAFLIQMSKVCFTFRAVD